MKNTYKTSGIKKVLLFIIMFSMLVGCGSVPKEVVELSYVIGEDLHSMNSSYDKLIHEYFENLRTQRRNYIDDVWYPRFLENWRDDGELVAIAKGQRIFSEKVNRLINTPKGTDPKESLETLNDWVNFALYAYEVKENELIKPVDDNEKMLRTNVNQAFMRLVRANSTITAHLNSLRKVNEVQDDVLDALNIKGLRDKINDTLVKISVDAKDAFEKVKEADKKVNNLTRQVNSMSNSKQ
jgi:hypothetical protein